MFLLIYARTHQHESGADTNCDYHTRNMQRKAQNLLRWNDYDKGSHVRYDLRSTPVTSSQI